MGLGDGQDDIGLFCTNSSRTTDVPTLNEMVQILRAFKAKHPWLGNDVDVLVMMDEHYRALKDRCEEGPHFNPESHLRDPRSLGGIRIESYPTRDECFTRAKELASHKVRVGLVCGATKFGQAVGGE